LVSKDRPDYLRDALDSLLPQNRYIKEILIFDKSEDQAKASRIKEIADEHSAILYTRPSVVNTSTLRNEGLVKLQVITSASWMMMIICSRVI